MDQENLISSLVDSGWYHSQTFIDPLLCQKLVLELNSRELRTAKIGKGSNEQSNIKIRNDSLFWFSEEQQGLAQNEYLKEMNALMDIINQELYLGLKQFEGHFTRYDQGGFYKKHLDQFKGNNERLISIITYLNTPTEGGELRIYSRNNPEIIEIDITPKTGSLVCFLSNQIYHEVLPTANERLSITGWLRTTIL